ncbi:hypothetical protein YC2023_005280 [Brassica napus]
MFDNFQVIANTNLELSDVVGQIQFVQGSDLSKETTRVVIRLLIDPHNRRYKRQSRQTQTATTASSAHSSCLIKNSLHANAIVFL